ncbi:hypothetical protein [Bradyrhizobium sp. 199]|nr:hypothetical protein [Bradyrhizobium sp. 199]
MVANLSRNQERFRGDQYLIAGKGLVIVDQHAQRVAAIIANVR